MRRQSETPEKHCFRCDRPLPEGEDIWLCDECREVGRRVDEALSETDPREPSKALVYLGSVALNAPLAGWPTDFTLLAIDVWDRLFTLRHAEVPGPNPPPQHPRARQTPLGNQPPRGWTITTDVGSEHLAIGGGGGTPGTDKLLIGQDSFVPSLPSDATRIDVVALAPGAESTITIPLGDWPAMVIRPAVVPDPDAPSGNPDCPSCGPPQPAPSEPGLEAAGIELDWAIDEPPQPGPRPWPPRDDRPPCPPCRTSMRAVMAQKTPQTVRPDRVIPLSADLSDVCGSHLHLLSIETWTTWFDLTIAGSHVGPWAMSLTRSMRWSATDDQGQTYTGTLLGSSSHPSLVTAELSFIPALNPAATSLTLTFPRSLGGAPVRTTVTLSP